MTRALVYRPVRDVIRAQARGRPAHPGTDFGRIDTGPWQRQRFFGPVRSGLLRRAVAVLDGGVARESFKDFRSLPDVQAAVWRAVESLHGRGRASRAPARRASPRGGGRLR